VKNISKAKKKFGQNFLNSSLIARKICNILEIKNENVLEIGPGNLALTKYILEKNPKKFLAIELDNEIVNNNTIINPETKKYILNQNALNIDESKYFDNEFIIISNLPFNISSKLLIKWIKFQFYYNCIKGMVLMFQKELGERIVANVNTKKYGRISVFSQSMFDIKKEILVKKENFTPSPKVDAVVLKFSPKKKINKINLNNLEKITNFFFNSKRKKMEKKIKKIFNTEQIINNDLEELYDLRAENISKEIYYKMSNLL
jgi:16S rRNA (adenine1518-N6/adenine1519-N6)-dimethyltransferase